jgi:hypothetical protein
MSRWYTFKEISNELGIPIKSIYFYHERGDGPRVYKFGKHLRVLETDLNKDINREGSEGRSTLMSPADVAEMVMLQVNLPRNVMLKNALFFPTTEWH